MPDSVLSPSTAAVMPATPISCAVQEWLADQGRYAGTIGELVREVGERFVRSDLPLARISLLIRTLHPMIAASGFVWNAATGGIEEFSRDHQSQSSEAYLLSPIRRIFEGEPGVRRRLWDPDCPDDFPILNELRAEGVTDYLVLPVPFSDRRTYAASFAIAAPEGFTDAQVWRIETVISTLALVVEILAVRQIAQTLANT